MLPKVDPFRPHSQHELGFRRQRPKAFSKEKSVSHSVEFRVKKGETPASISSQSSIGVVSAARLGAKLAAPPVVVQLVAAPSSRMTLGSSSGGDELCPNSLGVRDRGH